MSSEIDYTSSHKMEGKGICYDEHYENDPWRKFLWSREQLVLLDILNTYFQNREINLLDFACGTGRVAGFLENLVAVSVGVDVSDSMLEAAKKKLTKTELIKADITKEKVFAGRKFNLITAFRFFLNAEPELRKSALGALLPLLEKDGYFIFNNHRNSTSPLVRFKYSRRRRKRNFMSMDEMYSIAGEFGLEIVKIYPVGFLTLPKIKLPQICYRWPDNAAAKFKCLQSYSESPIAVCKYSGIKV